MSHGLRAAVEDLERVGELVRVREEVSPNLEIAEIQRRAYAQGAPALLFERVRGTEFPCVANLFGTMDRAKFIFRDTLELVRQAVRIKADPADFVRGIPRGLAKHPGVYLRLPFAGLTSLPRRVSPARAPTMQCQTTLSRLPAVKSWPMDGGPYITLPQVLSQDPDRPGPMAANVGMYRVQLAGNQFIPDQEVGLHYQIHRGMGIHHTKAAARGEPLRVSIMVGGHPAHAVAAVMPLPEGLSELIFAGMLAGRRFRYALHNGHLISADADFCIVGTITGTTKPEGPFGDHLGYYSLTHDFPVMKVEAVYHRRDAMWPFTVVGRPPQEDTTFGELIHEITGPMVPVSLPGVKALHAVDAAGVHPLLLAVGSERYTPYRSTHDTGPQELLTQANAILGFNQCSLAKYLFVIDGNDSAAPAVDDIEAFFNYMLQRIDLTRDLHFQTRTTMDTLDYSGEGLNQGSKLVIAATGAPRRQLAKSVSAGISVPDGFSDVRLVLPGVLAVSGPKFTSVTDGSSDKLLAHLASLPADLLRDVVLIVLCDDSEFCARSLNNFLWVTFTRSNPSHDCHGVRSFTKFKHWGAEGPLVIDARIKPHHAPPLVEDPAVTRRVDAMCAKGGSLHGVIE
ncbi:MAG: UbiD family decarboxylase [Deltaproteobacteria bacterium]|nr:UbiD family decarboxylase [Deltaproteobacteria bacterium]